MQATFKNFELRQWTLKGGSVVNARVARGAPSAARPALVLLHGFPQTHVMWRRVAQLLEEQYHIILPDLRGYGDSAQPPGAPDHSNYSKRAMAADVVALADELGIGSFYLAGHDRGARVAHRLALDHPSRVRRLCVIDVAPTLDMHEATGPEFAQAYYHWFHMAQKPPLPERMIEGCARDYLLAKLGGWGAGGLAHVEAADLAEYERCFLRPPAAPGGLMPAVHAACEDYRASAWDGIDMEHDRASRAAGQRVSCDVLAVWGARGVVARLFDVEELWRAAAAGEVRGAELDAGHFIPEERPTETAALLRDFFR